MFCLLGFLGFVAICGVPTAFAFVAPVDEGEADLRELELVAPAGKGGGEIGIQGEFWTAGFATDDGEEIAEIERA